MKSCTFFGHRKMNVLQYDEKLTNIVIDLIENKGVGQFYSGFRGDFDVYCSRLVHNMKKKYPHIKNTMILSYIPYSKAGAEYTFSLPDCFDDSIYILEKKVPPRLAIIETNKQLVDISDYIIAGLMFHGGGAYTACKYAYKRKKPIISVVDGWEMY